MSSKFHINPATGRPNKCHASKRACPLGGEGDHYPTREEAAEAYEKRMKREELPRASQSKKPAKSAPAASKKTLAAAKSKGAAPGAAKAKGAPAETPWEAQLRREREAAEAELARLREEEAAFLRRRRPEGFESPEAFEREVTAQVEERIATRERTRELYGPTFGKLEDTVKLVALRTAFQAEQERPARRAEAARRRELQAREGERHELLEELGDAYPRSHLLEAEQQLARAASALREVRSSAFLRLRAGREEAHSKSDEFLQDHEVMEEATRVVNAYSDKFVKLSPAAARLAQSFRGRNGSERQEDTDDRAVDFALAADLLKDFLIRG